MDGAARCHPGGSEGKESEDGARRGGSREIPGPFAATFQPRGAPGAHAVHPRAPIAASAGGLAPLPAPARTVTATEFMNLSEWKKKAGSLYHIQQKLSFKRKFSVITLKGAILTQSVTTLTCC